MPSLFASAMNRPSASETHRPWSSVLIDRRMGQSSAPFARCLVKTQLCGAGQPACTTIAPSPGGLAPEDADCPDHDQFEDRPADEGEDGCYVELRAARGESVRVEDPVERANEHLAQIEDARYEPVG